MTLVTRDATSGRWVPATAAEWTSLLSGTSVANPITLLGCQDTSGNLLDGVGSNPLTPNGSVSYANAFPGWSRKAVGITSGASNYFGGGVSPIGLPSSHSQLVLAWVALTGAPSATDAIVSLGAGTAVRAMRVTSAELLTLGVTDGSATPTGANAIGTTVRPLLLQVDLTNSACRIVDDLEAITQVPYTAPGSNSSPTFRLGYLSVNAAPLLVGYVAVWADSAAELSTGNLAILLDRVTNGPAVTSVAVSPSPFTLSTIGATQQLAATATRADGSTYDATATATWTSSDPTVATVSATGLVTAVLSGTGTATITASFTSLGATTASGTATCTVSTAITTVPLPVVGTDVPDLIAEALSRLLEQDKHKPNIAALLTSNIAPLQDVVNANWQLQTQRTIYTSIGQQLDDLGDLVGLPRLGLDDDDYRVRLFVEVMINRSRGRTEELIAIVFTALQDTSAIVIVMRAGVATVRVRVDGIAVTDADASVFASFVQRAKSGGVRAVFEWSASVPANTFRFDVGPGFDSGHLANAEG